MPANQTDVRAPGLDPADAKARLARYGPNELPPPPRTPLPTRLLRQLREPMALLLTAAAGVSGVGLGEITDAIAILAIVLINAVIGVAQEGKATRALEALRTLEPPTARLVRGGSVLDIPARHVVPGDLVVLSAGDRVPADLDLIQSSALQVDESMLTGESLPVHKDAAFSRDHTAPLAERSWMVFTGTLVTRGSGAGLVTATGPRSALGALAAHLRAPQPATPLQLELGRLTARLGTIAVLVAASVFGLTLARMGVSEDGLEQSFLSAVALAVAAVPEGLATVVTVALALGVRRMAGRGAIVRRLPAVETLGSTSVLLTDKTGTLTLNRMKVELVALPGEEPIAPDRLQDPLRSAIEEVMALCNDATLEPPSGDPLEVALLEAVGPDRAADLRATCPRLDELPFDSDARRMTTLNDRPDGSLLLSVKGAPETVLARSGRTRAGDGTSVALTDALRAGILASADQMATSGMRILGMGRRFLANPPAALSAAEVDLEFLGLVGLRDPVRPEAARAVAEARGAGIELVMVTGDHRGTAESIAREVGLIDRGAPVLQGTDLRGAGLPADPLAVRVYARVEPEQKLALVEAVRAGGGVVAVTGDGVNDAPALRRADIGVAMGRAGSDVAREAADMVITDDNLSTIVAAIREGRGIYDNIRKVVDYLVAGNLSEILVVVVTLLLFPGLGVPLLPIQLLWINLLTDGLPALALGVDPVDPGLMARLPRPRSQRLLGLARVRVLAGRAVLIAAASVGSLAVARFAWGEPWEHARAVMFSVLVTAHLLYAFVARRPSRGLLSNRWLLGAVGSGLLLQLAVVTWPAAHDLFGTAGLSAREWILVIGAGIVPVAAMAALPGGAQRH